MNDNLHFRKLKEYFYRDWVLPEGFADFVHAKVLPRLELPGYKRAQKVAIAVQVCRCVISATLAGRVVADTRNENKAKLRIQVWDALVAAKLVRMCLGSESSGMWTRYRATRKLLDLKQEWVLTDLVKLKLERGSENQQGSVHDLVCLHSGKTDPITGMPLPDEDRYKPISLRKAVEQGAEPGPDGNPDPRAVENGLAYFRGVEDLIERINRVNTSHTWQVFPKDAKTGRSFVGLADPRLRQIHSGKLFRAVRLYTYGELSGQNLSRELRETLLIGGEPAAELDYSGMATRMLYHFAGADPPKDLDIYKPHKVLPQTYKSGALTTEQKAVAREFVKSATNICWNVKNKAGAHSSVGKLLATHEQTKFLRKLVYDLEDSDPQGVVERIMRVHRRIDYRLFTQAGIDLMTYDGRIMLRILDEFVLQAGKPALAIHDALVCRKSDVQLARQVMEDAYVAFMRRTPVIKRVF